MSPDLVNGLFEAVGSLFISCHIIKAYKDKLVRGVAWQPAVFFTSWGFWNLYYYPSLEQWWSFWGGTLIVFANMVWVLQLFYYMWRERAGYRWDGLWIRYLYRGKPATQAQIDRWDDPE